jgi:hypothetical protein
MYYLVVVTAITGLIIILDLIALIALIDVYRDDDE